MSQVSNQSPATRALWRAYNDAEVRARRAVLAFAPDAEALCEVADAAFAAASAAQASDDAAAVLRAA